MVVRIVVVLALMLAPGAAVGNVQDPDPPGDTALRFLDVNYLENGNTSRLVIRANLPFSFRSYDRDENTLVIETEPGDTSAIAPMMKIGSLSVGDISVRNGKTELEEVVTEFTISYKKDFDKELTPKGRILFVDFKPKQSNLPEVRKVAFNRGSQGTDAGDRGDAAAAENPDVGKSETTESPAADKAVEGKDAKSAAENGKTGNKKNRDSSPVVEGKDNANKGAAKSDTAGEDKGIPVAKPKEKEKNAQPGTAAPFNLLRVKVEQDGPDCAVVLTFDKSIAESDYKIVAVPAPPRFVLDVHGARNLLASKNIESSNQYFQRIRTAQFEVDPYPISRLVLDLLGPAKPKVIAKGNEILLVYGSTAGAEGEKKQSGKKDARAETANAEVKDNAADKKKQPAKKSGPKDKKRAEVAQEGAEEKAAADVKQNVSGAGKADTPKTGAELESKATAGAETTKVDQPEPEVKPKSDGADKNTVKADSTSVNKLTEKTAPPVAQKSEGAEEEIVASSAAVENSEEKAPEGERVDLFDRQYSSDKSDSGYTPLPLPKTEFQEPQGQDITPAVRTADVEAPPQETREITRGRQEFTGKRVSLEFEDIELTALIRLLGELTDKNFIIDPSVSRVSVAMSLKDVPWDQALDIILNTYGLGKTEEGNVIRIATRAKLALEIDEQRQLQERRIESLPRRQITKPINYAKADVIANHVKSNLSKVGEVLVDARTSTLIITDIPSKVEEHLDLIQALDVPTRQVIIEARIVETTRDFLYEYGMQYGFRVSYTQQYGNASGLVFPYNSEVGGGFSSHVGDTGMAINLPSPQANTSILGTFSNFAGSLALDTMLTAAERESKIRVISRPRISAQNNEEAIIESGVEVPYQTVQNNTVSVQYKEAKLKLTVTPHITADNTIILDLVVDKSSLGVQTPMGYAIQKRQATSTILARDGGVAVIGGVLELSEGRTVDAVPLLSKIPLLGRLFRNNLRRETNTELLIFISPKIIS